MNRVLLSVFVGSIAAVAACVGGDPVTPSGAIADSGADRGTTENDAAPPDGGGTVDGGSDGAAPTFCSTQTGVTFCSDFEASSKPDDGWDGILTKGNGTVELITDPVRGVRTVIPAPNGTPANDSIYAVVEKKFPLTTNRHFVVELSMRPTDANLSPDGTLRQVRYFGIVMNGGLFGLFRRNSGWFLVANRVQDGAGVGYESAPLTIVPKTNAFSRIKLDVVIASDSTGRARLDIDGVQSDFYSGPTLGNSQTAPLVAVLHIGAMQSVGPTPALEVAFDDVTMTVLP